MSDCPPEYCSTLSSAEKKVHLVVCSFGLSLWALSTIPETSRTDIDVFPAQCEWEHVKGARLPEKYTERWFFFFEIKAYSINLFFTLIFFL